MLIRWIAIVVVTLAFVFTACGGIEEQEQKPTGAKIGKQEQSTIEWWAECSGSPNPPAPDWDKNHVYGYEWCRGLTNQERVDWCEQWFIWGPPDDWCQNIGCTGEMVSWWTEAICVDGTKELWCRTRCQVWV